jgi:two-component system sensor histidine kinase AgrC
MEILNNICVQLTTPNEELINIIAIPIFFIENYLGMLLFSYILSIKLTLNQKLIYVIITGLVSNISMAFVPNPYNTFINVIFLFIVINKFLKIPWLKSILATIIPSIVFSLLGVLISNPYITILHISADDLINIPIYRIFYNIIIYLLVLLIILILKICHFNIKFLEDFNNKTKVLILANLILGFSTLAIESIITFYYIDVLPVFITFFSFISLLAYLGISAYSLISIMKLNLTTKKLESAEEYNKTLRILHDNVRGFKHDFDNIVTTIGGYVRTDDMEGLKKYYLQLEDDCQKVNNLYLLNPEIINNPGVYNLLTYKYHEAESKNIKINMTFLLDLNTLKMKIYEFTRILGVLLDNAIEASSECDEKIINITFRNDLKNNRQLIIIENTYKNKDVDTEKIFEKGISEKYNHTGLGLWEVRKILSKNNNANLYTSKTDKFFSQQIELY